MTFGMEEIEPTERKKGLSSTHVNRLKVAGAILTLAGIALFAYFVYSVGVNELIDGISRFGVVGFAVILLIFFLRIFVRASAWSLSVYEPHKLTIRDTIPAVIIGEATSSIVPLGFFVSGTSKAIAVMHRVPMVVGLASVATENLFYSLLTSIFLILGAVAFLRNTTLEDGWVVMIDVLIGLIVLLVVMMFLLVIRQWHFASEACESLFRRGYFTRFLEQGRLDVRQFEDLIYGFYRKHPKRFLPICFLETLYHSLGIVEVYYVLSRLSDTMPSLMTAFLLESVSRLVTIMFKLIPLTIGVDEAGAQFVGDTVALAAGVGVTLAIIRKGRILFWTGIGFLLILKRGLSFRNLARPGGDAAD